MDGFGWVGEDGGGVFGDLENNGVIVLQNAFLCVLCD